MRLKGLVVLVMLLGTPGAAWSNAFDMFGCGSRGSAMGGALGATPSGPCSLYYNPATLMGSDTELVFGFVYGLDNLSIRHDHNPTLGPARPVIESQAPRSTSDIPTTFGILFGLMGDLGIENFRVGATAYLPANRVMRQYSFYSDEREYFLSNQLHFDIVGERPQHQVILVGGAYQVLPWLSIGGGVSLFIESTSATKTYLPNPVKNQGYILMDVENEQAYTLSPNIGVYLTPSDRLAFGFSWMGADDFPIVGNTKVKVNTGEMATLVGEDRWGQFDQPFDNLLFYSPHRLALSARIGLSNRLSIAAELTLYLWSAYRDLHLNKEWRFNDDLVDPSTGQCYDPNFCGCPDCDTAAERLDHLAGGEVNGRPVSGYNDMLHPPKLRNTYVPKIGVEYNLNEEIRFNGGLVFEPSPVPDQTGRTNIVDNDRIAVSVGAGFLVNIFDKQIQVDWHLSYIHLMERHQTKDPTVCYEDSPLCDAVPSTYFAEYPEDDPAYEPFLHPQGVQNPGYPGYASSGYLLVTSLTLAYRF